MTKGMHLIVAAGIFSCLCSHGGYVTDGLVLRYDAIDNAGVGVHSDSPSVWADLSGNGHHLTLPASGLTVGRTQSRSTMYPGASLACRVSWTHRVRQT